MKQEKQYANPKSIHTKAQALRDIQSYLGGKKEYDKASQLLLEGAKEDGGIPTLKMFRMAASFAGVQGYPAKVWHEELWPDGHEERKQDFGSDRTREEPTAEDGATNQGAE
jgi:hypothetical protein